MKHLKQSFKFLTSFIIFGFLCSGIAIAQDTTEPPAIEHIVAKRVERLDNRLSLTDEQVAAITQMFIASMEQEKEIHEQLKSLSERTKTKLEDLLTDEQKEKLGSIDRAIGHFGPHGPRGQGPEGFEPGEGGRRGPHGRGPEGVEPDEGGRRGPRGGFFKHVAEELGITEEQHEQIKALIEEGANPREAMEQVLTDEQKAQLEELRKNRPEPPEGPRGRKGPRGIEGFLERIGDKIGVTDEQKAQIEVLIAEGTNPREAMEQVLTDEQKAQLEELRKNRPEPPEGPRGRKGPRGIEGFLERIGDKIGVTDEQKAQIEVLIAEGTNPREAVDQVLTDEQKEQLKEMREARAGNEPRAFRGRGGRDHRGPRGVAE